MVDQGRLEVDTASNRCNVDGYVRRQKIQRRPRCLTSVEGLKEEDSLKNSKLS